MRIIGKGDSCAWRSTAVMLVCWVLGGSAAAGEVVVDFDGDGLTDLEEFLLGTDPFNEDSDFDSLQDGAEVHVFGTNPLVADTDGDGLSDGAEINLHGTNPTLPDTDGDGVDDASEVAAGSDALNPADYPYAIQDFISYSFNGSLEADQAGAPSLIEVDPLGVAGFETAPVFSELRSVYRFGGNASPAAQQGGLQFDASNRLANDRYTIEMVFELESEAGYRRILDTWDRSEDAGVYVDPDGFITLYPNGVGTGLPLGWESGRFQRLVIVNEPGDGVRIYLEGTLVVQVASPFLEISGPQELLSFWLDNLEGANWEYSPGRVAFLRIWDRALSPAEVSVLTLPIQHRVCAAGSFDADCDGLPTATDLCPFFSSEDQTDSDLNGIGDVCECGDQSQDGTVNVADLVAINLAIFDPARVTPLCDTNNDGLCNVSDIVGANLKIFGRPAYCSRYAQPDPRRVIGTQQFDILREPSRLFESAMGNLVTDAMRLRYPGVDAALTNSGGLRADLLYSPPSFGEQPGEITWLEVFAVLPFGNRAVVETLSGAQLEAALLNGLSPFCSPGISTGRFPQVSGLRVEFVCNGTAPQVTGLWKTAGGQAIPIGPADPVRIVTNDFMFTGGDGYTVLAQGTDVQQPGDELLQIAVEHIAAFSPVGPVVEGRILEAP